MENLTDLSTFSALMAAITLSAASGLRVFLPALGLGLATRLGWIDVGEDFAWLASDPVLLILGLAALLETGSYYIPWVDNLLDIVATPAAMAGGTVIVSALLPEMNDVAQWSTALALGGGSAGIVQGSTVLVRGASTASSGGLANPLVSTGETAGSIVLIILALVVPILVGLLVLIALAWLVVKVVRWLRAGRQPVQATAPNPDPTVRD